jgi:phospholipid transport system substrate-binding protein
MKLQSQAVRVRKSKSVTNGLKIIFMGLVLVFAAGDVFAGLPTDQLKASIDKVLNVLNDKTLKAPAMKAQRREVLMSLSTEVFDWNEMSKRSLGIYWKDRTPDEQKEFVKLFTVLLENTYMDKIESYSGEKILYSKEAVEDQYALVETKIITRQDTEVAVNYWMLNKSGRWFVYDISVEGISLVKNYRTQFNEIMARSSYQELLKKLKEKQVPAATPAL